MKKGFIVFVAGIVMAGSGCKKNKQDVMPVNNPGGGGTTTEKKWVVTTIAGNGDAFFADGPLLSARFKAPQDVAVTPDGTIYVADGLNHRIRKIANGEVSTFAGSGTADTIGGVGAAARFRTPIQLASDVNGNLYTLDVNDFRVRKISSAAVVTHAAGSGVRGFADGASDISKFGESFGIATDDQGNIYVSDWENKRIRKVNAANHATISFGPLSFGPGGIALDKDRNIYVVDVSGLRIQKIAPGGEISVFAGSGIPGNRDGNADEAQFSFDMRDLVIDEQGNLYLSDANLIRKISPQGVVSTIAGGAGGFADGVGTQAKFNAPNGLGIDAQGNIYVADNNNNRIRKISFE